MYYFAKFEWRTHDWSHGLPIVRQAFWYRAPCSRVPDVDWGSQSIDNLATRLHLPSYLLSCFICPMHCLPAVSYSDSLSASLRWQSYCGAGFLSGLSPRLPRFPEVPLLRYLVIPVSGVLVYMWPVLPVTWLTVISEESVYWFVCCRETDNLYPFVLEHLRPNLIYILLCFDITVLPGSTLRAFPFSHTQILNICIFIPAASAGLWWWIPSADFSEILTSTLHFILYHC